MSDREIITRAEARERGLKRYFTGKPCKHRHVAERRVGDGTCLECARDADRRRVEKNPEANRQRRRQYYHSNLDRQRSYASAYKKAHPEWNRAQSLKHYHANKIEINNRRRPYTAAYRAKNPDKVLGWIYNRALAEGLATPRWLTEDHIEQIAELHRQAIELTRTTGIKHEVDHIEPLQGKDRCGLHVPWNLQILTRKENRRKSNKPLEALP